MRDRELHPADVRERISLRRPIHSVGAVVRSHAHDLDAALIEPVDDGLDTVGDGSWCGSGLWGHGLSIGGEGEGFNEC